MELILDIDCVCLGVVSGHRIRTLQPLSLPDSIICELVSVISYK